jgi:hypothetical protein
MADPVLAFITEQIEAGVHPNDIIDLLGIPRPKVPKLTAAHILLYFRATVGTLPRSSLANVTTLDHVVQLLQTCRNILVIAGAGVSVSAGVPDFRTPHTGFYDILKRTPAMESVGDPQVHPLFLFVACGIL